MLAFEESHPVQEVASSQNTPPADALHQRIIPASVTVIDISEHCYSQ